MSHLVGDKCKPKVKRKGATENLLGLLKNKIHSNTFEDLIGFIKSFTNWAISQIVTKRTL